MGYADKGYNMNDLVGKDGVEKAFEEYLHGNDGKRLITTDENGKITGELYTREPQPGGTVALTIDIDLQQVVEDTLASTIQGMIDKDSNERGGAAAVIRSAPARYWPWPATPPTIWRRSTRTMMSW